MIEQNDGAQCNRQRHCYIHIGLWDVTDTGKCSEGKLTMQLADTLEKICHTVLPEHYQYSLKYLQKGHPFFKTSKKVEIPL
jgi:hypothetical protein